jgi:hypothetical protein
MINLSKATGCVLEILLLAQLLGCSPPEDADLDEIDQAVTGGTLVTSTSPPFNSAIIWHTTGGQGCSGVKIGGRTFLSAAHCLRQVNAGDTVQVSNRNDGTFDSKSFTITRVDRHASFDTPANVNPRESSFDVGEFKISGDTPAIPALPLHSAFVEDGTPAVMIGYGCDQTTPSHDKQKQTAKVVSSFDPSPDIRVHFVRTVGSAGVCNGDSGGPFLVRANGRWEVAALNAFFHSGGRSIFTRLGSVRRWLAAPAKNVFAEGESGNFLNGKSAKCIGVDGASTANGAQAMQFWCDSRNQPNDNQSWQLRSNGGDRFRIVNRHSGLCLGVDGASLENLARVQQFDCAAPDPNNNQSWRFLRTDGDYFQIVNGKSNKCLGVDGASTDNAVNLLQFTCTPLGSINNESWLFTR